MNSGRKPYPNDIADRFKAALIKVLPPGARTILSAFSGGADSTALLHLLAEAAPKIGFSVVAAHLDHGLRGEEGMKDMEFARRTAESLDVPFFSDRVKCKEQARKTGVSLEEAARSARYSFLERIRRETGADAVSVGHTADDNAELVLMNLLRGAGPRGLAGIPVARDRIIRPLLDFRRRELVAYLEARGLSWVQDSTNRDTAFTRNRIRLELIPYLEKNFNPSIKDTLNRTADVMRREESVWNRLVEEAKTKVRWQADNNRVVFNGSELIRFESALAGRLIRHAVEVVQGSAWGLSAGHVDDVVDLAAKDSGRIDLPGNLEARLANGNLIIGRLQGRRPSVRFEYPLPLPGRVEIGETGAVVSARIVESPGAPNLDDYGPETALLDFDAITPPLMVRSRKTGDKFQPLGMNGTKSISDFFTDAKIPAAIRERTPLVEDGRGIVWVCGHRPAEWAKIGPQTTKFLLLSLELPESG